MRAAFTPTYGAPTILQLIDAPDPVVGDTDVLVRVHASPVTAGDRRLRSADFPGVSAVLGRLMMGVFAPRHRIQGTMFAGRVVAVGPRVTRYAVGDDVFGGVDHSAYAELLVVKEDGILAPMPAGLDYAEAAAVPYGADTALHFLRDLAQVEPGEKVLIVGASGGVGRFAVQIAKHLGAEVSAVCSRSAFALVSSLGADHLIDHATTDFSARGCRYDVIFDIADASSFSHSRGSLSETGRYLTLYISVGVLLQMAWTAMRSGPKALFTVAMGSSERMAELRDLVEQGVVCPVVHRHFPLAQIADAHACAEGPHAHGAVLVLPVITEGLRVAAK